MKSTRYTAMVVIGLILLSGCRVFTLFNDTCSDGETMSDAHVASGFESAAHPMDPEKEAVSFVVNWDQGSDRGAELGDDYFASVEACTGFTVLECTGACLPDCDHECRHAVCPEEFIQIEFVAPRQYKMWLESDVAANHAGKTLHFDVHLGDRQRFIDCTHPGSGDAYTVTVSLTLDDQGSIADSSVSEKHVAGPL